MAEGFTINIPDFKRQMDAFGLKFKSRTARRAANAAAQTYKQAVVAHAPMLKVPKVGRTRGVLKRSIYVKRLRSQPGIEIYTVSFKKKKGETQNKRLNVRALKRKRRGSQVVEDPFYGRFLEAGWTPRAPGQKLRGGTKFRAVQRARNLAAGAKKITAYQFIAPAFKVASGAALRASIKVIEDDIAKENAKPR